MQTLPWLCWFGPGLQVRFSIRLGYACALVAGTDKLGHVVVYIRPINILTRYGPHTFDARVPLVQLIEHFLATA